MNQLRRVLRLCRTLQYVPARALAYRVFSRGKRLYYMSPLYGLGGLAEDLVHEPRWIGVELIAGDPLAGAEIAKGTFSFAGLPIVLETPPRSWLPQQASALWTFHLHYHEWLADLRAAGQRAVAQQLVADWLLHFGSYHPTVWHPYPTSLRLVAWLTYGEWLLEGADEDFKHAFYESVVRQAVYLADNPERDLGGNHLLKNLKALIYAGLALERSEMYAPAMAELLHELQGQILPDGMHYELTPMYAAQVLRDLLEVRGVLRKTGGAPKLIDEAVRRLGTALGLFVHGDGKLGLFNDSAELDASYVAQLLRLSGAGDTPEVLADAGYARLERGGMLVMFDAGKVGPDENPGHGHADMLSFELSVGRERVVVNGGTYGYQHALRNVFRGTAAHSTVSLEGSGQCRGVGGIPGGTAATAGGDEFHGRGGQPARWRYVGGRPP